jgi:hypothetical protein
MIETGSLRLGAAVCRHQREIIRCSRARLRRIEGN